MACTLDAQDGAAQLARWRELAARARPEARRDGHRVEVRFEAAPGVADELRALVATERRCCAFLTWTVADTGDAVVLGVEAAADSPDDVATVAHLFRAQ